MSATADIAWSRQLAVGSGRRMAVWTMAATIMLTAHAGAVWLMTRPAPEPPAQEAGGAAIEVDIAALGFAAADQVSAGTTEPVQPAAVEPVEPVDPAEPTELVDAVQPTQPVEPVETAVAEPVDPVEPVPIETPQAEPVDPVEPEPVETPQAELTRPEQPVEQAEEVPLEAVQPVPEDEALPALADVPVPMPRPEYTPPPEPKREPPRQVAETPKARSAGSEGRNQADTRKGISEGSERGQAARQNAQGARSAAAGNAAVSNYPGKIVSRLRRALQYPREARREGLRGEVRVQFTVSSSGQVGSVRVVQSSGYPVLDQAAVATVQRAAPFPAIPPGAGRSSWPFTVPLAFTR